MTKRISLTLFVALLFTLTACGGGSKPKVYAMQGSVKALNTESKSATIAAGKIGDWMDAMTMEYQVKPDADFQKLHVGDRIEAKVVAPEDNKYYVTDVKVVQ